MSLIKDVRQELSELRISGPKLRRFAWLMATVLALLAIWGYLTSQSAAIVYALAAVGGLFLSLSLRSPNPFLRFLYKIWMTLALIIGWFVSRFLLIIIFYIILTPVGLLLRVFGKRLLDSDFEQKRDSYWVTSEHGTSGNYEKMY